MARLRGGSAPAALFPAYSRYAPSSSPRYTAGVAAVNQAPAAGGLAVREERARQRMPSSRTEAFDFTAVPYERASQYL